MRRLATMAVIGALTALPANGASASQADQASPRSASGALADGAKWTATVPPNWNGTLLLYSHGYTVPGSANPARDGGDTVTIQVLLQSGYAPSALE